MSLEHSISYTFWATSIVTTLSKETMRSGSEEQLEITTLNLHPDIRKTDCSKENSIWEGIRMMNLLCLVNPGYDRSEKKAGPMIFVLNHSES